MNDRVAQDHPLLVRARALVPQLRAQSNATEAGRRVPAELATQLAEAGMYRMLWPRSLGGHEVRPAVMVRVLAALAEGDGAGAWTVMTGATTSLLACYLDPQVAAELWGEAPLTIMAGVFAPRGRAHAVQGGYRLSGRWSFTSGCDNAGWLMGGALLSDDDRKPLVQDGRPQLCSLFFPAAEATIHDTWDVIGLRGTGSHDMEVQDLFVPAERVVNVMSGRPQHDGMLYRFPLFGLLACSVAAVALGIGRAAIDAVMQLAQAKRSFSGRKRMAEQEAVQLAVARAEAELGAGRALLLQTCEEATAEAERGELSLPARARLRMAATHATRSAVAAVDRMYQLGGGGALYRTSPLQRYFRDVHTITQHIMVSPGTDKTVGRVLLGVETDVSQL